MDDSTICKKALDIINADAELLLQLIKVQMEHLTLPHCPLYEEVLDTHIFGLSREINFAVRLGLIEEEVGKEIINSIERKLFILFEGSTKK
ncbi:DUF1507 family protein [Fictibacillus nanhaiensis]|uniref:DUF1507 family protein n=1 Tax=Fictibacillus nanhaiensis TaxID=742169 RepID=UPI002E1AAC51|nr:DUF1507 family protein [Fictibacillus nanhaiensis]